MANSAEPDQTAPFKKQSDQSLHCSVPTVKSYCGTGNSAMVLDRAPDKKG